MQEEKFSRFVAFHMDPDTPQLFTIKQLDSLAKEDHLQREEIPALIRYLWLNTQFRYVCVAHNGHSEGEVMTWKHQLEQDGGWDIAVTPYGSLFISLPGPPLRKRVKKWIDAVAGWYKGYVVDIGDGAFLVRLVLLLIYTGALCLEMARYGRKTIPGAVLVFVVILQCAGVLLTILCSLWKVHPKCPSIPRLTPLPASVATQLTNLSQTRGVPSDHLRYIEKGVLQAALLGHSHVTVHGISRVDAALLEAGGYVVDKGCGNLLTIRWNMSEKEQE